MSKKSSLIVFIIVVVVLIGGITLWANSRTAAVTSSPAPSMSASSYTMAQVAQHKTQTDCWTVISGKVYNLTSFISLHPGGIPNIMKVCGVDGSATFTAQHGGDKNPMAALATLQIGILAQ